MLQMTLRTLGTDMAFYFGTCDLKQAEIPTSLIWFKVNCRYKS